MAYRYYNSNYRRGASLPKPDTFDNYRTLLAKRESTCSQCSTIAKLGELIAWHPTNKKVLCSACYNKWSMEVANEASGSCQYDY
jgi:hypothetical protein